MYPDIQLFIDGKWRDGSATPIAVIDPATEATLGHVAAASESDLADAVAAAVRGFAAWRRVSALERSRKLRRIAELIRERNESIARIMTLEQGKPIAQARQEISNAADIFDWFAEEGRRTYGRMIPARAPDVMQATVKEPVGPVAAFTPWNFPVNQTARKVAAALAAGCSIVVKPSEETPGSVAELIRTIDDADLPEGTVNMVFGDPAQISEYLIPHPDIRKVSFTGSTAVGKLLAAMAGQHMKRITMELGGHAPVIVFDDVDIDRTTRLLATAKYRNSGQVCISPTRVIVQDGIYDQFLDRYVAESEKVIVGNGLEPETVMGPLVSARRLAAVGEIVDDAIARGAVVRAGGKRTANKGYFYDPTILTDVPLDARVLNEEPFGPVSVVSRFHNEDDAIQEANRLDYGLAAYAYTRSSERAARVTAGIETGMISINHHGLGVIETPFGGVKDSGYGSEGGLEAIEAYLVTKTISHFIGSGV